MKIRILGSDMSMMVTAVLFTTFFSTLTITAGEALYQTFHGVDLESPCLERKDGVLFVGACALLCSRMAGCRAGSHNTQTKQCCLSNVFAYEDGVIYVEDKNSYYFQILTDRVQYGEWTLVFRALGGSGLNVYNKWLQTGYHDDRKLGITDIKLGCLTLNGSRSCDRHFRSAVLDQWVSFNVTEVRLSLYTNASEVLRLVFNGTGSSVSSWLQLNRVLQSPWTDLLPNNTYNSFSIPGIPGHLRSFFINQKYGGCAADSGWLCASEPLGGSRAPCDWENYKQPVFLYSKKDTSITWQEREDNKGVADVLAVFIK